MKSRENRLVDHTQSFPRVYKTTSLRKKKITPKVGCNLCAGTTRLLTVNRRYLVQSSTKIETIIIIDLYARVYNDNDYFYTPKKKKKITRPDNVLKIIIGIFLFCFFLTSFICIRNRIEKHQVVFEPLYRIYTHVL